MYEFRRLATKSLILRCKYLLAAYTQSNSPPNMSACRPDHPPFIGCVRSAGTTRRRLGRPAPARRAALHSRLWNRARPPKSCEEAALKSAPLSLEPRNL